MGYDRLIAETVAPFKGEHVGSGTWLDGMLRDHQYRFDDRDAADACAMALQGLPGLSLVSVAYDAKAAQVAQEHLKVRDARMQTIGKKSRRTRH